MTTDLVRADFDADRAISRPDPEQARTALAHYTATGDVSQMTAEQRAAFILHYAASIGVNPSSGAIEIIEFYDPEQKRKVAKVYAKAEALAQIGTLHRIRIETISEGPAQGGLYKVAVRGHQPDGRTMDEVGYVSITDRDGNPLVGNQYRNALMKCHTVAKRRLVRAMTGVGAPPPAEDGRRVYLGPNAEILERPTEMDRRLNDHPNEAAASGRPRFETMPPPVDIGLAGTPDQRPKSEHLEPPTRPDGPAPTFRPSDEDVKRWLGAWFAAVKGSSLDDDEERHRFIRQWTAQSPTMLRTDSLRAFLAGATERQAGDLLAHVRALVADEKRAILEADSTNARDEPF
jgi:hypothetical protein